MFTCASIYLIRYIIIYMQLHQIHYHDQLLKDMSLPHRRKGMNLLAEALMPYQSADYDGVCGA